MSKTATELQMQVEVVDLLYQGGWIRGTPADYNRATGLCPADVVAHAARCEPDSWRMLRSLLGDEGAQQALLAAVQQGRAERGTLAVLRQGVSVMGHTFLKGQFSRSEFDRPRYDANTLRVIRELAYAVGGAAGSNRLDLAGFCNGLPLTTAELKALLRGAPVEEAVEQYQQDRRPEDAFGRPEPLLAFGSGALVHFAVDEEQVYFATDLRPTEGNFVPFNKGDGEAWGNARPAHGRPSDFLWSEVLNRDSVLEILDHLLIEERDEQGALKRIVWPRYHQRQTVLDVTAYIREHGHGSRLLVQHWAGSGKSKTIAMLARHSTLVLHRPNPHAVDKVLVLTDRVDLDDQLARDFRQTGFAPTEVVYAESAQDLAAALAGPARVILSTLQKFPHVRSGVAALAGQNVLVIVDEAHSSQGGRLSHSVGGVLAGQAGARASDAEADAKVAWEDLLDAEVQRHGRLPNATYVAFTATPKDSTLHLFASSRADGRSGPFAVYGMGQAVAEGFCLDPLACYLDAAITVEFAAKAGSEGRLVDPARTRRELAALAASAPAVQAAKARVIVADLIQHVLSNRTSGSATRPGWQAMLLTESRADVVAMRQHVLAEARRRGVELGVLVAFHGTMPDPATGAEMTEWEMNGDPGHKQGVGEVFVKGSAHLVIVADKLRVGYDNPRLTTLYVDQPLQGPLAVQALSRVNRPAPGKSQPRVLDFRAQGEEIFTAFACHGSVRTAPARLTAGTLLRLRGSILAAGVLDANDARTLAQAVLRPKGPRSHQDDAALVLPFRDRARALPAPVRQKFLEDLRAYEQGYNLLDLAQELPTDPRQGGECLELRTAVQVLLPALAARSRRPTPPQVASSGHVNLTLGLPQITAAAPAMATDLSGTEDAPEQPEASGTNPGPAAATSPARLRLAHVVDRYNASVQGDDRLSVGSVQKAVETCAARIKASPALVRRVLSNPGLDVVRRDVEEEIFLASVAAEECGDLSLHQSLDRLIRPASMNLLLDAVLESVVEGGYLQP